MKQAHPGAASNGAVIPIRSIPDFPALSTGAPSASRLPDMATQDMLTRLPKLDDDGCIGVEMDHIVQRDGEADLKFTGTLLASTAPEFRGQDRWWEYRVYRTSGGTYVFSKTGRSILDDESDKFEAYLWNAGQGDWRRGYLQAQKLEEALTSYFKFDSLAKQLYVKLKVDATVRLK